MKSFVPLTRSYLHHMIFAMAWTTLCLSLIHFYQSHTRAKHWMVQHLQYEAELLSLDLTDTFTSPEPERAEAANQRLARLRNIPHILHAGFYAKDGRLIAVYTNHNAMHFTPSAMLQDGAWRFNNHFLELAHPVVSIPEDMLDSPEIVGRLYMRADLQALYTMQGELQKNWLLSLLLALAPAGIVLLWLRRRFNRTVRRFHTLELQPSPSNVNAGQTAQVVPLSAPTQLAEASLPDMAMPPSPAPIASSTVRVLLVEDNTVNAQVAKLMLRTLPCTVEIVEHGEQAVQKQQEHPFDMILMDCLMPVMDGYQATRHIRRWENEQNRKPTPIIALTAGTSEQEQQECRQAGMDDYLSKPLKKAELDRVFHKWANTSPPNAVPAPPSAAPSQDPTDTPAQEEPLLDDRALAQIRALQQPGAGDNILSQVIQHYLQDSQTLVATLQTKLAEQDIPAIHRAAHTLKSSSANLGANRLADLCKVLESQARAGKIIDANAQLTQLSAEHQRVCAALRALQR